MKQHVREVTPSSFAETVQIVAEFVRQEIVRETKAKKLYYHTIDHAVAVRQRADQIFEAIQSVSTIDATEDVIRLRHLLGLCAFAHDMVQVFADTELSHSARKRDPGISETATLEKLLEYLQQLNQTLEQQHYHRSLMFGDRDLSIIQEAIMATVCQLDPQAGRTSYSFSKYSIYQPYLYQDLSQASIVAKILALADLGTLGMVGIEQYLKEGILVFLEDNLDLENLILHGKLPPKHLEALVKTRLLNMARFMVSLAEERKARFHLEIASFSTSARQVLEEQVFIYLNPATIKQIKQIVPTAETTTLSELIEFFTLEVKS